MEFEYDPRKSEANQAKHAIDFANAQALRSDPMRVEVPARTSDEERWLVIGQIDSKLWAAVVTYRTHRIRIISVRRARSEEAELYEG